MQRPAKPFMPVRFRLQPPIIIGVFNLPKYNILLILRVNIKFARVVELVDTRDLKSLASNGVPVQVRPRVPVINNNYEHN